MTAIEQLFKLAGGPDAPDDAVRRVGQQHPELWRDALLEVKAALDARQRAAELQHFNPTLADQVAAVSKSRRDGAHMTFGADMGHRAGPGVFKVAGPAEDDEEIGPVRRRIRRMLPRRGR